MCESGFKSSLPYCICDFVSERSPKKVNCGRLKCPGLGERPSCLVLVENIGLEFRRAGQAGMFVGEKGWGPSPGEDQP